MKHFGTIILMFGCFFLVSCLNSSSSSSSGTDSDVAQLTAFYFADNDSFPGLGEATFTIKELTDTGWVYNEDSIRYGTPLDSVVPRYTYYTTPYSAVLHMIDSERGIDTLMTANTTDTLNFNCEQIYLSILSRDQSKMKVYRIEARVHQVDPNLYRWAELSDAGVLATDVIQQLLIVGEKMMIYANDGLVSRVRESSDRGVTWSAERTVSGLPGDCNVRTIVTLHDSLYYVQGTTLYVSANGTDWMVSDCSGVVKTMHSVLMAWIDTVWVVGENTTGELRLYKVEGNTVVDGGIVLDAQFPVSGFAAVTFCSTSDRARAMVMGGISRDGHYLNSRWNMEYSRTHHLMNMTNYAKEQPKEPKMTGASIVWYNNRLHLLGGWDEDGEMLYSDAMYVSDDEGMNWSKMDTTQCLLPSSLTPRYNVSMVVKDDNIYIYGGQSRQGSHADLYCTRLQSIDWD